MLVEEKQEVKLIDSYKRHLHKLRVQLTDACNFRCFYCLPQNAKFKPKSELLTPKEIFDICSALNKDFGIDEIRLTGGEPTLRSEFAEIVDFLSVLPLKKFGLTTNGYNLEQLLPLLKSSNCTNINVSLDSLRQDSFNNITSNKYFKTVYSSILKAKEMDFNIKVNTVLLRGVNDHEIFDFINFSAKYGIEVRFLELMKIGQAYKNNNELFISAGEVIDKIKQREILTPVKVSRDSTSFRYNTSSGGKIGFIASESRPFCGSCSRLRLSATGKLRACLMSQAGTNLRGISPNGYKEILEQVIAMKPYERIDYIEQPMYEIGG